MYYTIYQTNWTKEYIVQNQSGELVYSSLNLSDCAEFIFKQDQKNN